MNREDWKAQGGKALDWIKAHPETVKAAGCIAFGIFLGYLLFG